MVELLTRHLEIMPVILEDICAGEVPDDDVD